MDMILQQSVRIDSERCDRYGRLRADALFLLMQNVAGEHAERLGVGRAQLVENGTAWVLTRVSVRMQRWPNWDSVMTLTTAPGAGRVGLYRRYFEFVDHQGMLGHATTLWTVIDLDKRAIVSPDKAPVVPPAATFTPKLPSPAKVRSLDGVPLTQSYRCQYTDVDLNGHINNAAYIRFLENSLPAERFEQCRLSELDVCYHHEILPDRTIDLTLTEQDDRFHFAVKESDRIAFEGCGKWE